MAKNCLAFISVFVVMTGLINNIYAQKPAENRRLEILSDEKENSYRIQNMRISKETGIPLALYKVNYIVRPDRPENMARQYLRENSQILRIKTDLSDLAHTSTRETPGGYHVRFLQYMGVYPVYKAEIVVNINRQNQVTFVMNGYKSLANLGIRKTAFPKTRAVETAKNYLNVQGKIRYEETDTVVHYNKGKTRLAYKTSIIAGSSIGNWEILVDATTGEIFKAVDNALYYQPKKKALQDSIVTGSGLVFDPDPLTRSGAVYNDPGFTDNSDADSDSLTAQLVEVDLLDITLRDSLYSLDGPYAKIIDFESPRHDYDGDGTSAEEDIFAQPADTFHYTRSQNGFEAVNVYYHIDKSMRYINETLGFDLMPFKYTGGVQCDPHGLGGADNSHYLPSVNRLAWGEGGVDDAEDQDVILHELGHGIHDWITNGSLSQAEGLSEGSGDYWTVSYVRSLGFWQPSDEQYNWVFQWDGHNDFWPGRITNYTAHYPEGLTGSIHTDGQMWSSTLMSIWNDIGRKASDSNFLEALSMLSSNSNQEDAAQAFVQADINLYSGVHLSSIGFWFDQRGYNIDVPSVVTIPLRTGFNLISWNIDTENDSITVLLANIMDKVDVVLSFEDSALTYSPDLIPFSTLHKMDHLNGYWIKMSEPDTLTILGASVDPQTPIELKTGFNLVSYLPGSPANVESALESVFDDLIIVLAFDSVGLTYDPNLPQFSNLNIMSPLLGYWIKLTTDNNLVYPDTQIVTKALLTEKDKRISSAITPAHTTNEWINLYGENIYLNGNLLPVGKKITAVDKDGVVCGITLVEESGNFGFMPVYRDYPMTTDDEGASPGEEIAIYLEDYKLPVTIKWTGFGDTYNLSEFMDTEIWIPQAYNLLQNYPNPFNPHTTIHYQIPRGDYVSIKIFNLLGQEIVNLVDKPHVRGSYTIRWNGKNQNEKDVASGIYIYRMKAGEFVQSKKMLLLR